MKKQKHTRRRDRKKILEPTRISKHLERFTRIRQGKSELPLANPQQVDKRHFCTHCGRRREQRFLVAVGWAPFGNQRWACNDNRKLCAEIRQARTAAAAALYQQRKTQTP